MAAMNVCLVVCSPLVSREPGVNPLQHLARHVPVRPGPADLGERHPQPDEAPDPQQTDQMRYAVHLVPVVPAIRLVAQSEPVIVPDGVVSARSASSWVLQPTAAT
ncbi:hypothetical protein GCM10012279_07820 [Micromonospora yangpuensis]|nr:hypothetical protein GCM10012279_07820 [Micromonospora yangpuensis]